jgi:hypothetical protein
MLRETKQFFRLEHVAVENMTQAIVQRSNHPAFIPCSVIGIGTSESQFTIQGQVYQSRWRSIASHERIQWFTPTPKESE